MPSKNKPNAFIVYAQSIRQQLTREGHVINNTADLVSAAGPYWKDLPEDEKNLYKNLAKEQGTGWRGNPQRERSNRRDNTGELIENRVNKDEVRRQRVIKERLEVVRQWPPGKDVIYERFYLISFTIMLDLRHLDIEDFEKIVPCEVSLAEYSLDQGIERSMHKFICPGNLRLGFRATAMSKSENTHKIPVEGLANEDDTYSRIYEELCCFVMIGRKVMPPVFCKATEVEQTELALKWLAYNSGKQPMLKKVFELEGLLIDLGMHLSGQKQDLSEGEKSKATSHLTKSVFDYERGTRCAHHEEVDSKYCSLGIVKKWCYLLSDFLLDKAGIDASPNHLPVMQDEESAVASVRRAFSAASISRNSEPIGNQQRQQPQQHQQRNPYQQQQLPQQHQQNSSEIERRNAIEAARNISENNTSKQPIIGRGRGLAQALVQQRRPGERPQEPKKLAVGRGRASVVDIALSASRHSASNGGRSSQRTPYEEPSARPKPPGMEDDKQKFASFKSAPAASFAPPPPSEWMFS